jgi:nitrogen regulatory protein PII
METTDKEISSNQIKDNKAEGYFELTVTNPEQLEIVKSILNKSPKINTIKEMKNSLTKNELQEMIRQQLQTTLAEKKKVKGEKEKEKLDEVSDVLIAGLATLLGVGGTIVAALVSDLRKAKTKEEKAAVLRRAASTIDRKMSGGM